MLGRRQPAGRRALTGIAFACCTLGACHGERAQPQGCPEVCDKIVRCAAEKSAPDAGPDAGSATPPPAASVEAARAACEKECRTLDMALDAGTAARALECAAAACDDFDACLGAIRHAKPEPSSTTP